MLVLLKHWSGGLYITLAWLKNRIGRIHDGRSNQYRRRLAVVASVCLLVVHQGLEKACGAVRRELLRKLVDQIHQTGAEFSCATLDVVACLLVEGKRGSDG